MKKFYNLGTSRFGRRRCSAVSRKPGKTVLLLIFSTSIRFFVNVFIEMNVNISNEHIFSGMFMAV